MSITLSRFVPNIMAFGAVAAGNMKANDAAMVAGSIKSKGFISMLIANPANTGKKVSTVARFEVNSVKKVTKNVIESIMINGCTSFNHNS